MADNTTPAEYADQAAEAVRSLNRNGHALNHPADTADTIAGLRTLAHRLPQALEQTAHALTRLAHQGRLRVDPGHGTLGQAQDTVYEALRDAVAAAHALEEALGRAHAGLARIGWQDPPRSV